MMGMGFWNFVLLLIIAGFVGGIAQSIVGLSGRGCLVSIAIGLIGALLGNYLAKVAALPDILSIHLGDHSFPLVWSVVGAVIFVAIVSIFQSKSRR